MNILDLDEDTDIIFGLRDLIYYIEENATLHGHIDYDTETLERRLLILKFEGIEHQVCLEYNTDTRNRLSINLYKNKDDSDFANSYLKLTLSNVAKIDLVNKNVDFTLNGSQKIGEYLMKLAHKIFVKCGYSVAILTDNSYLILEDGDHPLSVDLWLYRYLNGQKSWYHKFGYIQNNSSISQEGMDKIVSNVRNISLKRIVDDVNKLRCCSIIKPELFNIGYPDIIEKCNMITNIILLHAYKDIYILKNDETLENFVQKYDIKASARLLDLLTDFIFRQHIEVRVGLNIVFEHKFSWYHYITALRVANENQINYRIQ